MRYTVDCPALVNELMPFLMCAILTRSLRNLISGAIQQIAEQRARGTELGYVKVFRKQNIVGFGGGVIAPCQLLLPSLFSVGIFCFGKIMVPSTSLFTELPYRLEMKKDDRKITD